MASECVLFVEGTNDKLFIRSLLDRMGLAYFSVEVIGGGVHHLQRAQRRIQRLRDDGIRVAVVLDANSNAAARRREFASKNKELDLRVDHLFLFPDNRMSGDLEDLLERIAASRHNAIHECFSIYVDCLRNLPENYDLPDAKARIFAYCEAVGNGPRESERDYGNADHWDLDAEALYPLKDFLLTCA